MAEYATQADTETRCAICNRIAYTDTRNRETLADHWICSYCKDMPLIHINPLEHEQTK